MLAFYPTYRYNIQFVFHFVYISSTSLLPFTSIFQFPYLSLPHLLLPNLLLPPIDVSARIDAFVAFIKLEDIRQEGRPTPCPCLCSISSHEDSFFSITALDRIICPCLSYRRLVTLMKFPAVWADIVSCLIMALYRLLVRIIRSFSSFGGRYLQQTENVFVILRFMLCLQTKWDYTWRHDNATIIFTHADISSQQYTVSITFSY